MTPIHNRTSPAASMTIGVVVVLFFEWHTDEPLVVLPVLLIAAFATGLAAPRWFALSGAVLGWSILAAHLLSNTTGILIPRYQHQPPMAQDWIAMALLVVPAVAAAFAGSRVSTRLQTSSR